MMRQWMAGKQMLWVAPVAVGLFVMAATACPSAAYAVAPPQPTRTSLALDTTSADTATAHTTLTAHVTDTVGGAIGSAGTVSFEIAAGSLGSALVDADGNATLTLGSDPVAASDGSGVFVRAVYHPLVGNDSSASSGSLASSASAPVRLKAAAGAVPDFLLTINPSSVSTTVGLYATTAVIVTPQNGFSEQVTLSCNNLPAQVTCSFSPAIQSTAQGAFTSTLELQTQTGSGSLAQPDFGQHRHSETALAWLLPGACALLGLGALRRKAGMTHLAGMALLLAAGAVGLGGCSQRYGYLHHPPLSAGGTPTGTYVITVSAGGNDGSSVITHTSSVTLQVR